ncbi:hypothetical protein LENED_005354 [Lentinula edodes]|uniref:Uncharacterized protein n=1 Tax=Lentinula edodes TaxID=5353 RepID=A0A1Q3E8W8_LENED|nr:hypothetical protein LENED_005354 [Lentinula edodes]
MDRITSLDKEYVESLGPLLASCHNYGKRSTERGIAHATESRLTPKVSEIFSLTSKEKCHLEQTCPYVTGTGKKTERAGLEVLAAASSTRKEKVDYGQVNEAEI